MWLPDEAENCTVCVEPESSEYDDYVFLLTGRFRSIHCLKMQKKHMARKKLTWALTGRSLNS